MKRGALNSMGERGGARWLEEEAGKTGRERTREGKKERTGTGMKQ